MCDGPPEIIGNLVTKGFSYYLTWILNSELNPQILIPIRIWFKFPFSDPPGVVLVNVFCLEVMVNVKFLQSGPDREGDVSSLRVEVRLTPQFIGLFSLFPYQMLPVLIICQEQAVVFSSPTDTAIGPINPSKMQDLP